MTVTWRTPVRCAKRLLMGWRAERTRNTLQVSMAGGIIATSRVLSLRNGVSVMVPHRSRSNRTLPVAALTLVLAVALPSCDRGADPPPAGNRAPRQSGTGA